MDYIVLARMLSFGKAYIVMAYIVLALVSIPWPFVLHLSLWPT